MKSIFKIKCVNLNFLFFIKFFISNYCKKKTFKSMNFWKIIIINQNLLHNKKNS